MGEPDVDLMLSRMTSRQLTEWMAFYEIEPFGDDRADLRSAIAAAGVAQAMGAKVTASDFMPFAKPDSKRSEQDVLKMFASMPGAVIVPREKPSE